MQLLEVIPIARGISKETLSYFSKEPVPLGSLVFVPMRNRTIPALVVDTRDARIAKAELRHSSYALKKIANRKARAFLPDAFMEAVAQTARMYATTRGAVLHTLVPQALFREAEKFSASPPLPHTAEAAGITSERLVFQAERTERFSWYRSMIRESFAKEVSVSIIVPTIADVERIEAELSRGIEDYVFSFHSGLTKKEMLTRSRSALKAPHPLFLIGTPSYLPLCRPDIETVIIERENSRAYKHAHRPHIDMRFFIEAYAAASHRRIILAGMPLRIETMWRYRSDELQDVVQPKTRLLSGCASTLVDMREEERRAGKGFSVLSRELSDMLGDTVNRHERAFLFSARRGIASMTVCKDCGSVVTATDGSTPMILRRTERGNAFVSYRTGEMRSAKERCRVCQSWHLEALGVGIERVEEAVRALVPQGYIVRIDKDATPTHRKACAAAEAFYRTDGAILLGTELALPFLTAPIEHSAVVSADSLLSLPEWRIPERVFSLILSIRESTTKNFLLQTRRAEGNTTLEYALSGNIGDFYREEIALRKEFGYPPFSVLVKMSVSGTPTRVEHDIALIEEAFDTPDLHIYPSAFREHSDKETRHALLRVPRIEWPESDMLARLESLPPHITIDIDPENLL